MPAACGCGTTSSRRALGVRLRYPTYREGLRALFDGGYDARDPLATPR